MAFASSLKKGQIPVSCQLCEGGSKIQWNCCDCDLLMCTKCKEKVHPKFKNGNDHKIIDIKEVGQQNSGQTFAFSNFNCQQHSNQPCCIFCKTCKNLICVKCITKTHKGHDLVDEEEYFVNIGKLKIVDTPVKQKTKKEIKVVKHFTSDLQCIHYTAVCSDGSLWIGDWGSHLIQHIQIKGDNIQELLTLDTEVLGMAVTPGDELLVCGQSTVKLVSKTGEIKDSQYIVAPLLPIAIHVTSSNTVIIGAMTIETFAAIERGVVIKMDQKGNRLVEYELDRNSEPLFSLPKKVTRTSEGNICVIDRLDDNWRGRVVVLSPAGDVINTYSGHSDINNETPFAPSGITTTLNNIVVVDRDTHTIHILDSEGHFITYYSTKDLGIIYPYSVALSTTGNLFIGCAAPYENQYTYKAKFYEVEYSGF